LNVWCHSFECNEYKSLGLTADVWGHQHAQ
jgi:hypothetical protein